MCIVCANSGDQNHEEASNELDQETKQADAKLLRGILSYQVDTEGNRIAEKILDGSTRVVIRKVVVRHAG